MTYNIATDDEKGFMWDFMSACTHDHLGMTIIHHHFGGNVIVRLLVMKNFELT